jgi:hypothetical protein
MHKEGIGEFSLDKWVSMIAAVKKYGEARKEAA